MFAEMKLGRLPSPPDDRSLKLVRYLRESNLSKAPKTAAYSPAVVQAGGYGMLANDRLGCCVISAMMHLAQQQSANDGRLLPIPPDSDVVRAYSAIGGYKPGHPDTDRGCNMLAALKYWRKTGITIDGEIHRIGAFAAVDVQNPWEVTAALWLFGGIFTGFALPLAVQNKTTWADVPRKLTRIWKPGTWGGHAVVQADYASSNLQTVTWGQLVFTDQRFFQLYCDEAWVVISPDWLGADNKCPPGFDAAALAKDLEALA